MEGKKQYHKDDYKELLDKLNLKAANIESVEKILDALIEGKAGFVTSANLDNLHLKFEQLKNSYADTLIIKERKRRRLFRIIFAIILLVVSIALFFIISTINKKLGTSYMTGKGEVSQIAVNDATVYLNSETRLNLIKHDNGSVTIRLKEGVIYIDNRDSVEFEILYGDKKARFVNGNVEILSKDNYTKTSSLNAFIEYKDGESLVNIFPHESHRENNDKKSVISLGTDYETSVGLFTRGYIGFEQEPLSYALKEISKAYQINIVNDNKTLDTILVTGVFSKDTPPIEILRTLLPPPYGAEWDGSNLRIIGATNQDK